jgi:fatty-acyl-CoA synthase
VRPRSRHLADLLDEITSRDPSADAIFFEDERLTYGEFRERAREVGKSLLRLGVQRGDRVAMLMTNRTEWPVVAFGAFQVGATLVPISTWYRSWDIDHVLSHCSAKVLISVDEFRGNDYAAYLTELAPELKTQPRESLRLDRYPSLEKVVIFGEGHDLTGTYTFAEFLALGGDVTDQELDERRSTVSPDDYCYILYTSGSTAAPKGVPNRHHGCCENGYSIGAAMHFTGNERLWLVVPLAWSFGSANGISTILSHGGAMILQEYMDPGHSLEILARHKATAVYVLPHIVNALTAHESYQDHDLSAIRTGNTPGTRAEVLKIIETFAPEICTTYGATETYGICTSNDAADPPEVKATGNGFPLPGMDVSIVNPDTGTPVAPGETGHILISGLVVPGYWNDPENTGSTFADGVYHSGDLGYFDPEGRLHLVGRIKEMIRVGGINVAPAEIEEFLNAHPQIRQAYVVGMADPAKGEAIAAFVVAEPGSALSQSDLRSYCKARIASFKVPSRFIFLAEDEMPRTSTGKPDKRALAKRLGPQGG